MKNKTKSSTLIMKILVGGFSVLIADLLLRGVSVNNWWTGFLLAAVIILINITIKPLMILITLPITLFTFGLFLLVINAFLVLLAAEIVPGFYVDGFWWALCFAICLSLFNGLFGNSLNLKG